MSEAGLASLPQDGRQDDFIRELNAACRELGPGACRRAAWRRLLLERGWVAPGWPAALGGTGWNRTQIWLFHHITQSAGCPLINGTALEQVAPLLIQDGPANWTASLEEMLTLPAQDWCIGWCRKSRPGLLRAEVAGGTQAPEHALLLLAGREITPALVPLRDCRLLHADRFGDSHLFTLEVRAAHLQRRQLQPLAGLQELVRPLARFGRPASTQTRRRVQALKRAGYAGDALTRLDIRLGSLEVWERLAEPGELSCRLAALELEAEAERLLQDALGHDLLPASEPAQHNLLATPPLAAFRDPRAATQLACAPGLPPQLVKDLLAGRLYRPDAGPGRESTRRETT